MTNIASLSQYFLQIKEVGGVDEYQVPSPSRATQKVKVLGTKKTKKKKNF